jgi:hypothetical protein
MIITVTSIKLRKLWYFFILSYFGLKIQRQTKINQGFIKMKNTGFGYWHYTLSAWESEQDMKNFARSGEHLEAMKNSKKLSTEIRVYTFQGEEFPAWKEAKKLLFKKGRVIPFR